MDIGEKQTNLLVKIGGVDALNELVDSWYAKMAEEGLTIDPSLLDSIIELQKSTLENLLSGQDDDVGSTGLHTVHTTNGVNFSENEQKKATKLFRECVTSMGVAKAVEKEICAVCKATSWLNMENGGHSNFDNISLQMLKVCKQNWKEYIAACGDEHVAGRLIMEGLYGFGAAYRSLHKLPPRTFSFRFVNQVDRFVRMAAPENEGMLRTELFQLSVKHVDFLTEKQFAEWSEVTLDSMIETIQAATDDTWGSTHQESWRVVFAWLNTVLWEQIAANEPRVRRCITSWNIIADQHMNTNNDDDDEESALMAQNTVGDETAAKQKNMAAAARAAAKKKAANVDYLSETIMASRQVYIIVGQSFYFNATTMGVPIGEKAKRDIETVSELFGTFIGILLKFMCDPDAREEQSYLLSLRHLKYIELSDTEMIPALRPAFIVTLRSLLPRDWNKQYEESWAWLWDQTSAMFMGHCKSAWHARERIDNTMEVLRKLDIDGLCLKFSQRWINVEEITGFFDKPLGFQKIILLKLIGVVSTIYHEPGPAAEEIRGVGIRHVKYKVPEHLLPLLSNTVFQTFSVELPGFWNEDIEGAWRAPVGYFQKTMARAMRLGMNEVCRCCVAKDLEDLKAVLRMAPRGERNMWILETRAIGSTLSPFYWMLHENRTVLFSYMLEELYTIRADQENYYCGNDELFATHPGFVENLAIFLPGLFPLFFDHLVWISRNNENRMRRVNYYLKNVYGDPHQKRFFDPHNTPMATLLRLAKVDVFGTPVAQCLIRLKWESFGEWMYVEGILPYIAIFFLFMAGQVFTRHPNTHQPYTETSHLFCQVCMGIQFAIHLFLFFGTQCTTIWREKNTNLVTNVDLVIMTIAVPSFFTRFSDVTRFILNLGMIIGFITDEHMVHEFGDWIVDFDTTREVHSWGISVAVTLFTSQLYDLFALGNRTMRFKLTTESILSEVIPFLGVLCIMYTAFGAALSVNSIQIPMVDQVELKKLDWLLINIEQMSDFGKAFETLFAASISCLQMEYIELNIDSKIMMSLYIFVVLFLFVTMITGSVSAMCHNVSSDAERLCFKRQAADVIELESSIALDERVALFESFEFEKRVEFDTGDLGLPGAIQIVESVTAHRWSLEKLDRIFRYAGDTNPKLPWPEDESTQDDDPTRKLKQLIDDLTNRLGKTHGIMKSVTKKAKAWKTGGHGDGEKGTTTITDEDASGDDSSDNGRKA